MNAHFCFRVWHCSCSPLPPKTLREIWQIVAEEQPYTFLFYPQFVGLKSDVRGFVPHPQFDLYRLNDWWLEP